MIIFYEDNAIVVVVRAKSIGIKQVIIGQVYMNKYYKHEFIKAVLHVWSAIRIVDARACVPQSGSKSALVRFRRDGNERI